MKKQLTKIMATALSVAMVAANPLTVFADNPHTEPGRAVEANILAFKADTFVVPTDVELALNPGHFTVTTDGTHGGTVAALESNAEIISFTYGVANLSTSAKNLEIKIDVSDDRGITFIGDEERYVWIDENGNGEENDGEIHDVINERNDYAINLRLETSYNTLNGDYDNNVKKNEIVLIDHDPEPDEYVRQSSDFILGDATFDAAEAEAYNLLHPTTPVVAGDIDVETLGEYLSDVDVTAVNNGFDEFARVDGTVSAKSDIFLYQAGYHNTNVIDFDTTQADLANNNMQLSALGGIAAFSFDGAINTSVDWTAAGVSHQITLTPTYKFTDVNDAVPVEATLVNGDFRLAAPQYGVIANVIDFKVNGEPVAVYASSVPDCVYVKTTEIKNAIGIEAWNNAEFLEFTFTIGDINYRARIRQNGEPVND